MIASQILYLNFLVMYMLDSEHDLREEKQGFKFGEAFGLLVDVILQVTAFAIVVHQHLVLNYIGDVKDQHREGRCQPLSNLETLVHSMESVFVKCVRVDHLQNSNFFLLV